MKIVNLMNLAVVMRDAQVCVVDLVLEIDVKIVKISHQLNIVLESISKCVATTGNVNLRHATQKRKLKVKLVGEWQLAWLHLLLLQLSVYASVAVRENEKAPGNQENRYVKGIKVDKIPIRRTVEQHEDERQSQQLRQSQQESLNIQNLGPYTNQPHRLTQVNPHPRTQIDPHLPTPRYSRCGFNLKAESPHHHIRVDTLPQQTTQ